MSIVKKGLVEILKLVFFCQDLLHRIKQNNLLKKTTQKRRGKISKKLQISFFHLASIKCFLSKIAMKNGTRKVTKEFEHNKEKKKKKKAGWLKKKKLPSYYVILRKCLLSVSFTFYSFFSFLLSDKLRQRTQITAHVLSFFTKKGEY